MAEEAWCRAQPQGGTGRPRARAPRKVNVPPGSSEEAGRASLSGVHRAHLPDAASLAWPPSAGAPQANMALFFLPRGLKARGVSATLSPPTSLWARTAHLPVSLGQLSGQPQTVTSKRAGRVIPQQPSPGSTLPVSMSLTLGTCTGYASGWQPYTQHPSLLRPSEGSHHSPQAHRPHTPPGPGCPTWHHLSSRRRPTRALSAPRVAGTTSH